MAWSAAAKALSLVLFLAAVAGATYAVGETLGVTVSLQPIVIDPVIEERSATPGHTVSYLVTIENRGLAQRAITVTIDGEATGVSPTALVPGNNSVALFVPVTVPATLAPGEYDLSIRVSEDEDVLRVRENAVRLVILPEAPSLEVGDKGELRYTGRLADTGRAFASNDPALVGASFLKTDQYQYNPAALPISTAPRNVVEGIYEGILGMQPGETRTFTFGYDKGYGPPSENDTVPRREVVERTLVADNEVQRVPRQTFDEFVVESGQGAPSSYEVGSTFQLTDEQNTWPYEITLMTEQVVEYKLHAEVGDSFTIYPFWPLGSEITEITDDHVTFYTTPTTTPAGEGACPPRTGASTTSCLTMHPEWPSMSAVDSMNETHVVVRHDPPTQYRYTTTLQGQTREVVVLAIGEDEVTIAVAAAHPLAGRALTFDVTLLSITKPAGSSP